MNIREAIKHLAENNDELYLKIGTVTDIDPDRRTCDVAPLDGSAPLPDVKLQAGETGSNALIAWPRRGSHVVVGFLNADAGCVLLTHDPERIQATVGENTLDIDEKSIQATAGENSLTLDGNQCQTTIGNSSLLVTNNGITLNGGKLKGLVNIDALQNYFTLLNTAISTGLKGIPTGGAAGASAFELAAKTLNFNGMEDKNVKH